MRTHDWSTTIAYYPAHKIAASEVIGVSHMSVYTALRLAERMGFFTGLLILDGYSPLEEYAVGKHWVAVASLFADRRVANTEGVISSSIEFIPAVEAEKEKLLSEAEARQFADEANRPWIQIIDNEHVYWGGLSEEQSHMLMTWFLTSYPHDQEREGAVSEEMLQSLMQGLRQHGWTRNGDLIRNARVCEQIWWGGVHQNNVLRLDGQAALSVINSGVRLLLKAKQWRLGERLSDCPLDDEKGRAYGQI